MSDKRETDKIKFFEVGTKGEIRPAFPNEEEEGDDESPVRVNSTERFINDKLLELKPQIDSISKSAKKLSDEETEILTRYIGLKEAEAEDLRVSLGQYQEHFQKLTAELSIQTQKNREINRELGARKGSEAAALSQVAHLRAEMEERVAILEEDQKAKTRARESLERELLELERKKEEWKSRVSEDLRRIRLKERELETKHELLKRDSQALLDSKDKHLLELKRKCDALELEMEEFETKLRSQGAVVANVEARKKRLLETMRLALSLLEGIDRPEP